MPGTGQLQPRAGGAVVTRWMSRSRLGAGCRGELPVGELIVLVGAPGSGKSSLAARLLTAGRADVVLSTDSFAEQISGDPGDQDCRAEAIDRLQQKLGVELAGGRRVIVDATLTRPEARLGLVRIACRAGVTRHSAYLVRASLQTCLARNAQRPGPLPGQKFGKRVPDDWLTQAPERAEAVTPIDLARETFRPVYIVDTDRRDRSA